MIRDAAKKNLLSSIRGKVYFNRPFRERTYFKIGGRASVWVEPLDIDDLRKAVSISRELKVAPFVFGKGSNLLVSDKPLKKIVIELSNPFFKKVRFIGRDKVACGSGAAVQDLVKACIKRNLGGLEFLAGIPGSVGGAVIMNAGADGVGIGRLVDSVKVMGHRGSLKELKKEKCVFGYRKSNLSGKVVVEAVFRLKKADGRALRKKFRQNLKNKMDTQKIPHPNAGCIFKNPHQSDFTTGQLLDLAGLKGKRIGNAQFSRKHANFIVNLGNARFQDVRCLMRKAQTTVKEKYNICLEPEIIIIN